MSDFTLGDVTLEVLTTLVMPPAQPNEDPLLNWPTSILKIGTQVIMANGVRWRLFRDPELLEDGRTKIEFRHPSKGNVRESFAVPLGSEEALIWNTGELIPVPEEPEVPDPEVPIDPAPIVPVEVPQIPGDGSEPVLP